MENLKQTRKIGTAGSFQNQIMGNNSTQPKVGEWFTHLLYSDRKVGKVVEVSPDGLTAKLQNYSANAVDYNQGKDQYWDFKPIEDSFIYVYYNVRKGAWEQRGTSIVFTSSIIKEAEAVGEMFVGSYLKRHRPEILNEVYQGQPLPQKVVAGITREKIERYPISIIFGVCDYRYDWEF